MILYPPEKRHFRGFRTVVRGDVVYHPAYIIGEDGDCYLAFVITHAPMKGGNHPNHKLKHNPKATDPRDSYMVKKLVVRPFTWFREYKMKDLILSEEDKPFVAYLISKLVMPLYEGPKE